MPFEKRSAFSSKTLAWRASRVLLTSFGEIAYVGMGTVVYDLPGLRQSAGDLRQRLAEFIKSFGPDLVPELHQLHEELAEIDKQLAALADHLPDEEGQQ